MIEHCRGNPKLGWLANVITGLACTGMRISELASLRWADLDLKRGLIQLADETGLRGNDGHESRELKSGKSRTIQLHEQFRSVLGVMPRDADGYVFHGPRGGRLKPDTVRQVLIRDVISHLASKFPTPPGERGIEHGRLHSFRHYFASLCGASPDVSELTAKEWLGHQDSQMVRHYFHLHADEARRQMARLDPLGTAGMQLAGDENRAATQTEASPSQSEPTSS